MIQTTERRVSRRGQQFAVVVEDRTDRLFWDKFEAQWEDDTLRAFDLLLNQGSRLLDIGGWIGPTALYAAARGAQVTVFEPDPVAYAKLERNLTANPMLEAQIEPRHCALWSSTGTATLHSKHFGDSMSSLLPGARNSCPIQTQDVRSAEVNRLIRDADLVKIDIEGGEFHLLPVMRSQIADSRPTILLSLHALFLPQDDETPRGVETNRHLQEGLLAAIAGYPFVYRAAKGVWSQLNEPEAALAEAIAEEGFSGTILLSSRPLALKEMPRDAG